MILKPDTPYIILQKQNIIFDTSKYFTNKNIVRNTTAYQIITDRNQKLWTSKNIILNYNTKNKQYEGKLISYKNNRFIPIIILLLSIIIWIFSTKSKIINMRIYIGYYLLWLLSFLFILYQTNVFFIYSNGDAQMFFRIAEELVNLNRTKPVPGNIGTAFFCIPFVFLFNTANYLDIAIFFSFFNLIFIGGGCFILTLMIAKHLTNRPKAFHTTAISCILSSCLLYIWRQGGIWDPNFIGGTSINFYNSTLHPYAMYLYNKCFLYGWNRQSDNYAVFFMLLSFTILIKIKPALYKHLLLGTAMGFAFSIRYGCITFFPLIIFWDLYSHIQSKNSLKKVAKFYVFLLIGIIVGSFPQLLDNYIINKNFLLPTVNSNLFNNNPKSTINLFGFVNLKLGYKFFLTVLFKPITIYIFLLYFIKDVKKGIFFWLWLFIPLTFYGYSNMYGHSCLRYLIIIFPALYIILGNSLKNLSAKEALIFTPFACFSFYAYPESSTINFSIIYTHPSHLSEYFNHLFPLFCGSIVYFLSYLFKTSKRNALFFLF